MLIFSHCLVFDKGTGTIKIYVSEANYDYCNFSNVSRSHSHVTHSRDKTQLFRHNHEILAKLDHQRYLKPTKVKKNAKMLFYLVLSGNAVAC